VGSDQSTASAIQAMWLSRSCSGTIIWSHLHSTNGCSDRYWCRPIATLYDGQRPWRSLSAVHTTLWRRLYRILGASLYVKKSILRFYRIFITVGQRVDVTQVNYTHNADVVLLYRPTAELLLLLFNVGLDDDVGKPRNRPRLSTWRRRAWFNCTKSWQCCIGHARHASVTIYIYRLYRPI